MLLPAGPAHCPYLRGSVLTSVGLAGQFLRGVIGRSTTQRGCSDRFRGQIRGVTDRSSPKRLVRLDDTRLLPYRFLDTTVLSHRSYRRSDPCPASGLDADPRTAPGSAGKAC